MKSISAVRALSICIGLALSGARLTANAQQSPSMPAGQINMSSLSGNSASPSTQAFKGLQGSRRKMMTDMSGTYTGDTDRDFVSHMIPHHQGAVAMAEVELKHGKDPEMKRLAANIVRRKTRKLPT